MQEVSKRWESDMKSDSWLSKNTRPMSLIFLTISMVLLILLDSFEWSFSVSPGWVDLLQTLLRSEARYRPQYDRCSLWTFEEDC